MERRLIQTIFGSTGPMPRMILGLVSVLAALGVTVAASEAQTVVVRGSVVADGGQPLPFISVLVQDPTVGIGGTVDFFTSTRADGTFQITVPPAIYVVTANPLPPRLRTAVRVDARAGDVNGLVLQIGTAPHAFVPDVPPRASLIQVSAPDSAGDVTVTGGAGSVPADSAVFLITLDTGHVSLAIARPDGSFTGSLFAPRGTSIQVKADPLGLSYRGVFNNGLEAGSTGVLNSISGTILRVPDASVATGVPFAGAGVTRFAATGESPFPAWTAEGTMNSQALNPGDTLRVQGTLRIASPALAAAGAMTAGTVLTLERLTGADGRSVLAKNSYASTFLTPTGLPIERLPRFFNDGFDRFVSATITKVGPDRAEASFDLSLPIPAQLPAGHYRPFVNFNFSGVPVESPPSRWFVTVDRANRRQKTGLYLPILKIGAAAAPRVAWMLLADTLSNGTRGTRSLEDRDRFGLASRILTQSETFIVPRIDPSSGRPLTYRLEPFAPTVALGDQVPPNPPLVPFRFPSGSLTVRITKPDGSVQVLGPSPFAQNRMKSLVTASGFPIDGGGGHITDLYEISTMDPQFEVQFSQDGRHVITLEGNVQDVWGTTWTGGGTYEVHVARTLSLDTAVLPGTPFEVGDVFNPGVIVTPAVPADIAVRFQLAPNSESSQMVERSVKGRASRFGYFHPLASGMLLDQPGEYRVDVTASFRDENGILWMGSRTWGGVVARTNPPITAHGRRGIDGQSTIGPQWFFRTQTGIPIGGNHVPFPFNAGDIIWEQESDAAIPHLTFQDPQGSLASLLRARALNSSGQPTQIPLSTPGTFDQRAAVGELPLFSSRPDRIDPHLDPSRVDLWGYSYRSVQRPFVRIREEISEDSIPPPYWRFNEGYGHQIGVSELLGDLPNEVKFQYGAVVLRGPAIGQPQYALYGSLFVLVPENDPAGGTRTLPPFQGNGGGPSGGPIITLKGRAIDLFMHLTGVRPGSVLEVGDTFALSGAVGPTLPALVSYTVTPPSGPPLSFSGRANRVGHYYHSEHDLVVSQPGLWTIDLRVTYDGLTSAGQVGPPFPTGDVLGTADGRFAFYVVPRGSAPLAVNLPRDSFLTPPVLVGVSASAPSGMSVAQAHVSTMMPGFLLESRTLVPANPFAYSYDSVVLARDFPNLDVANFQQPGEAITVSLFASGGGAQSHAARVLTLHGMELLNLPPPAQLSPTVDVTTDRAVYQRSQPLSLGLHLIQGTTAEPADIYIGLLHPDGTFDSLLTQGSGVALIPTGTTPTATALNAALPFDFSAPVATRSWTPADPPGTYVAFAVRVRPGQSPFDQANWLSLGYVGVTLNP